MSSELISGLGGAILGAILSGVFAWWLHRAEQLRSRKEELRNIVSALIDLQEEYQRRINDTQDPGLRESIGSFTSAKRAVYLEAAEVLTNQLGRDVSSAEYNILATELMSDTNFAKAEQYYIKAVEAARSMLPRVVALRSLAAFYFGKGSYRNIDKGREHYSAAVSLLKMALDEYSTFVLGHTYQQWGFSELSAGSKEEGHDKIRHARTCYGNLPDQYHLKTQALAWLDRNTSMVPGTEVDRLGMTLATAASNAARAPAQASPVNSAAPADQKAPLPDR